MERKNVNIAPTAFSGCNKHLSTDNGVTENTAKANAKKASDDDKEEDSEDAESKDDADSRDENDSGDENGSGDESDSKDDNDSEDEKDKEKDDVKDESVSGNSAGDTSSDKKDSISKKKSSKKKSSSSALERVIRTKSGYSYTKLPAKPKSASSSANDENLIGQTKISGGNALIIPVKR